MTITAFPPVNEANEFGLLAAGGDLEIPSLLLAYRSGVFPWPIEEDILTWFAPPRRAILPLDQIHISRSLAKAQKQAPYTFAFNRAFPEVIQHCASSRNRARGENRTWIVPEIVQGYINFHRAGYAHSVEAYSGSRLVGGLYGVAIGKFFAGESMFYLEPNASKLALLHVADHLRKQGIAWIDCQVLTPLLEQFGAVEISREEFMTRLGEVVGSQNQIQFS